MAPIFYQKYQKNHKFLPRTFSPLKSSIHACKVKGFQIQRDIFFSQRQRMNLLNKSNFPVVCVSTQLTLSLRRCDDSRRRIDNIFFQSQNEIFCAFSALFKASTDLSKDQQNPLEAGTSGNSGIFSLACVKDSGPFREISSSGVVLEEQFMAAKEICRQLSTLSISLESKKNSIEILLKNIFIVQNTFGHCFGNVAKHGL